MSFSWSKVSKGLVGIAAEGALDESQQASVLWIAARIGQHGLILADEVGTGKTRIACALVRAVMEADGRAAVVVPSGLMHQWDEEMRELNKAADKAKQVPAAKRLSTIHNFIQTSASQVEAHPAETPEWWLISHGFRAPVVQTNINGTSADWTRIALPALVLASLADSQIIQDRRTVLGEFFDRVQRKQDWAPWWQIAMAIGAQVRVGSKLHGNLEELAIPRFNKHDVELVKCFQNDGDPDARVIVERLLGTWLGPFDLVIVDEAHKGGEDANVEANGQHRKLLPRLLGNILRERKHKRRIALTATPMELSVTQWADLLARCCVLDPSGAIDGVLQEFDSAIKEARCAPDEIERVERLIVASRAFEAALEPYVTRRRRSALPEMQAFAKAVGGKASSQSHRRVEPVHVRWDDPLILSPEWRGALFAAECLSAAARGGSEHGPTMSTLYTRLAAGHVSADAVDDLELEPDKGGPKPKWDKDTRVRYWHRRFVVARRAASGIHGVTLEPEASHPRVLAAVEEIERFTASGEKVLVFGVYVTPQRHLHWALNVRDGLRRLDHGLTVPHTWADNVDIPGFDALVMFHFLRMKERNSFEGRLLSLHTTDDLRGVWHDGQKRYDNARARVNARTRKLVDGWAADPTRLRPVRDDSVLLEAVQAHLTALAMDEFLAGVERDSTAEDLKRVSEEFWLRVGKGLAGESAEDDDARFGRFRAAVVDLKDPPVSWHCRRMGGKTAPATRQNIQAAFNRRNAAPHVLIAQSMVGREGLNLHLACRVVLQFHPEWNPGVLEQQIGRVDRKGSLWAEKAGEWMNNRVGEPPMIEVRQMIFDGTYDARQWGVVRSRQDIFHGSLFGALLPDDALARLDEATRARLFGAAPNFDPTGPRVSSQVDLG